MIGPKLLLITTLLVHMRFRLILRSVTLDDLERSLYRYMHYSLTERAMIGDAVTKSGGGVVCCVLWFGPILYIRNPDVSVCAVE